MTNRIYKTARGKSIDIGALALRNEKVRAVGNMGVNAAGDKIDSNNNVIKTKAEQSAQRYSRQSTMSDQIPTSAPIAQNTPVPPKREIPEINKLSADFDVTSGEFLNVAPPAPVNNDPVVDSGFAAALKKAAAKKDDKTE